MAGPSGSATPQRNMLGLIQQCLGLSASNQGSEQRSPIDVARVPPYPFEQDAIFLAISTTVSADEHGIKGVEVGVATLDTARLADQELPPGFDGGHWAEKINFTTFIAHPTATSYACDLEIGAHVPDWVLGCTRQKLASWLEKVWQRTEDPQISTVPPSLRRNIIVLTRSKDKLFDDLGQLGFELEKHYAVLDVFTIAKIYKQYRIACSPGDANIPQSFRAIRNDLRINEPIRHDTNKRSSSAKMAHAILQAAVRCAVNNACLLGQQASGNVGRFARPGVVTLDKKEALTRLLSIQTTYTLPEIRSRVVEMIPTHLQPVNGAVGPSTSSSNPALPSESTKKAQSDDSRETAQPVLANSELDTTQVSNSPRPPGGLSSLTSHPLTIQDIVSGKSSQLLQNIESPKTDHIIPDTDCLPHPVQPQTDASELPEDVKLDIRAYHRATAAVLHEMAYIAKPYCDVSDFWSLDDVSDRITTESLLALSTTIHRVAHIIRDNISHLITHQLRRDLDSCILNRTKACKYYASRLGTYGIATQNDRQQEAVRFLQEIHGILFPNKLQRNVTAVSAEKDVHTVPDRKPNQSSEHARDPLFDTQQSPSGHGPKTGKNSREGLVSPPKAAARPLSASSFESSVSEDRVLTPPSSIDDEEAASSVSSSSSSQGTAVSTTNDVIYIDEPRRVTLSTERSASGTKSDSLPSGEFRSDRARHDAISAYQRDTRWFFDTLVDLAEPHYDGAAFHGSIDSFRQTRRANFGFYKCLAKSVRLKYRSFLDSGKDFNNMRSELDSAIWGRQELRAWHERQGQVDEKHVAFLELLMELKEILEGRSFGRSRCCWKDAASGTYGSSGSDWESMDED